MTLFFFHTYRPDVIQVHGAWNSQSTIHQVPNNSTQYKYTASKLCSANGRSKQTSNTHGNVNSIEQIKCNVRQLVDWTEEHHIHNTYMSLQTASNSSFSSFSRWTWASCYQNVVILHFIGARMMGVGGNNWSEWVSEWVNEWVCVSEWVGEWVNEWVREWVGEWGLTNTL